MGCLLLRAVALLVCLVLKILNFVVLICLKIKFGLVWLEPSELSIRQLMRECKEALKLAVGERQKYISRVKVKIPLNFFLGFA